MTGSMHAGQHHHPLDRDGSTTPSGEPTQCSVPLGYQAQCKCTFRQVVLVNPCASLNLKKEVKRPGSTNTAAVIGLLPPLPMPYFCWLCRCAGPWARISGPHQHHDSQACRPPNYMSTGRACAAVEVRETAHLRYRISLVL